MNNGEFVLGKVFPKFATTYRDGEIDKTFITGYEIEYSTSPVTATDKDDVFKPEGRILFPVQLLGKTYEETVKNVECMLKADKTENRIII